MSARIIQQTKQMALLAMPYPYQAWLTISNDPDNTTIENWKQLHQFIWEELQLPFADALFLKSYNQNIPGQVNFFDHPQILKAHPHDSLHFWGDYQHARKQGFDRTDAEEATKTLAQNNFQPRVWVDHSSHRGNFTHNSNEGTVPFFKDASGVEYQNFNYTLDIARQAGIKYIWDGNITPYMGQDLPLTRWQYLRVTGVPFMKRTLAVALPKLVGKKLSQRLLNDTPIQNKQLWVKQFADGNKFYCFSRYGTWHHADIDGLAQIISPENVELLIQRQGTCVAYTHLGKRKPSRQSEKRHIPDATQKALENVNRLFREQTLMLSSISGMLDYLVLRNSIRISDSEKIIHFIADGIRYNRITKKDLQPHCFSFSSQQDPATYKILADDTEITPVVEQPQTGIFSLRFG